MEKFTGYVREPFYYETDQMGIIHHSNYGEKVSIHPTIQKYTGTRLDFSYEIVGTEDKKLKTTGSSKHCFLLSDSQRLVKLSKVNPELDQLFQAYASLDDVNS